MTTPWQIFCAAFWWTLGKAAGLAFLAPVLIAIIAALAAGKTDKD